MVEVDAARKDFKSMAWNGIGFRTPESWEVLRLGKNYLLLESHGRPTMEVKWGKIRGRFSAARQLKRLAAASRKAPEPLRTMAIPQSWRLALASYEASAFTWADQRLKARGVLLYCTVCRQACLVQFFSPCGGLAQDDASQILDSFWDHPVDKLVEWRVFDIGLRLPRRYELDRFRFEPGRYRIDFKASGQVVTMLRWGPADALMGSGGLPAFAAERIDMAHDKWRDFSLPAGTALQWQNPSTAAVSIWKKLMAPMQVQAARIWHLPEKNQILAVTIQARRPPDDRPLNSICNNYAVY